MSDKTNSENLPRVEDMEKRSKVLRTHLMKDLIQVTAERKMLSIGQPFVGSMVITDSPQKNIYRRVQWFDTRKMTYQEAGQLATGLSYLGDCVMFDCFSQIAMVLKVAASSAWREQS